MIISHKKKFIQIHVSRTGGGSTKIALKPYADLIVLSGGLKQAQLDALWKNHQIGAHSRPAIIKKFVGKKVWNSYFKFVFVRNPYEWVVSRWSYNHRKNINIVKKMQQGGSWPQQEFEKWISRFYKSYYLKHINSGIIKPGGWMSSYVFNSFENQVVDFVGRFENLNKDFVTVCKKLGISAKLGHVHAIKRNNHYSKYYTKTAIEIATEMFNDDLRLLNYSFDRRSI